jgi:hypothetical protein
VYRFRGAVVTTVLLVLIVSGLSMAAPASPSHGAPAVSVSSAAVAAHSIASTAGSAAGACGTGSSGSLPSAAPSAGPHPAGGTTGPGPLFNTQVVPFAQYTGPYSYVAGGAALRNSGFGLINLTWPSGTLVAAYLVWSIIDNSVPASNATLNGGSVNGTWTAYATPSPCWSPTYIYTFAADVTDLVVNGTNNLTGIPSGITTGADPWSTSQTTPMDDSASLVIIYAPTVSPGPHQVTVSTGALPITSGGYGIAQLNYTTTVAKSARTTFLVADGQLPDNSAWFNGSEIDPNAFSGNDPHEGSAKWSYGNLSDTKTYSVNVTVGSNNTTAEVLSDGSDCLTWVGQVLSVKVPAEKGPYNVTFEEQGLVGGTHWGVTTNSTTHSTTVGSGPSSVVFRVGNGTHSYSISTIPGFIASHGRDYRVDGGPVFIRLIFHQVLFQVSVNQTGLPGGEPWWVDLFNTTQSFNQNTTSYAPTNFSFLEGNATYNYTVGDAGLWRAEPSHGTFVVDGSGVQVNIHFIPPPLFPVTFREHGLPGGTSWGGETITNWIDFDNSTTQRSFTLGLPNATSGEDYLDAYTVPGYTVAGQTYFGVSGAPTTVNVYYAELYTVNLHETGLPVGTSWNGYLTNTTSSGSSFSYGDTANVNFSVPNGSYKFLVEPVYAYNPSPATGYLNVTGVTVTIPIVFTPAPTYAVTFNETGLAAGSLWSVQIQPPNDIDQTMNSTSTSFTWYLPNGSYEYFPTAPGYQPMYSAEFFYLNGAHLYESITFTKVYPVTFTESGLPSGTYWDVYFEYTYHGSDSPTVVIDAPNGNYSFYTYDVGYFVANVSGGGVEVLNGGVQVQITYTDVDEATYAVTFLESGLPTDSNWSVTLNGYTAWTSGTSLGFTEPNGSFPFTALSNASYPADPASGTLNVTGGPASQTIVFGSTITPPPGTYVVTFTESGLPSGATWYANVTGQSGLSATVTGSSGTYVQIALANGSYSYVTATSEPGWTPGAHGGFTVAGAPVPVSVPFTGRTHTVTSYDVTFTETGLGAGATWYINISGESGLSATVSTSGGTNLVIALGNGSYTYSAASNWKNYTVNGGTFSVAGSAQSVPVVFTAVTSTPPPSKSTTSSTSAPFPWIWAGVGLLVVVLLLFLILLLARRRKKREVPPPSGANTPPPPPGPPGN